jgi:hypothetical protein
MLKRFSAMACMLLVGAANAEVITVDGPIKGKVVGVGSISIGPQSFKQDASGFAFVTKSAVISDVISDGRPAQINCNDYRGKLIDLGSSGSHDGLVFNFSAGIRVSKIVAVNKVTGERASPELSDEFTRKCSREMLNAL